MITPDNIYQDDWTQRLKENPSDPLEDIRQEHEGFLTQLEALAVEAIATSDWSQVRDLINDFKDYQHDSTNQLCEAYSDTRSHPCHAR